MRTKIINAIFFICFLALTIFLGFNRHARSGYDNYHSVIWADKAGYHVYLPAALKYGFNPDLFPENIEEKTGNGFTLDTEYGKVLTKYTYGVALMQMPFYLLMDVLAPSLGFERNGYSPPYHWAIYLAGAFYLCFGLLFLLKFLRTKHSKLVSIATLLSLFLASNLYFYAVDESGMSHVYSFFLFSLLLYQLRRNSYLEKGTARQFLFLGLLAGLIILIRPSNAVFLPLYFVLDLNKWSDAKLRLHRVFKLKPLVFLVVPMILILLPQMLYWNYSLGSWLGYSYGEEGFNWMQPQWLLTWFSPNNGLFLYHPFYGIVIVAMGMMVWHKKLNGIVLGLLFLLISYVFSSWWAWHFGCSFGARSYVEILAVFSIPLAFLMDRAVSAKTVVKWIFGLLLVSSVVFNLMVSYSYDGCVYAVGDWDWQAYAKVISSAFD